MEYFTLKEQWICSLCHKRYLLCYFSFQAPSSVLLSNTVLTDTKAPSFKFRSLAAVINRYIAFVSIHTLAHHFFALLSQKGLRKKEALPGLHTSCVCFAQRIKWINRTATVGYGFKGKYWLHLTNASA